MKDTFGHLKNVLEEKQDYMMREGEDFSPYLIQRWISMFSPQMCFIVNETTNTHHLAMQDKQMWHDSFLAMMPKIPYRKVQYIKKPKKIYKDDVKELARRLEISCREAQMLAELDEDLLKKEKSVEVSRKRS